VLIRAYAEQKYKRNALYNQGTKPNGGFLVNISLAYASVFLVVASSPSGFPPPPTGLPSTRYRYGGAGRNAMKAQHERMGNFEEAMVALGKAMIHEDKSDAEKHARQLTEACGHEKDVPHKNVSRTKEFQASTKSSGRGRETGGRCRYRQPPEGVPVYGRVLEACLLPREVQD